MKGKKKVEASHTGGVAADGKRHMLNMANARGLPQAFLEIVKADQLRPVGEEHIIPLILECWDGLASSRKNA